MRRQGDGQADTISASGGLRETTFRRSLFRDLMDFDARIRLGVAARRPITSAMAASVGVTAKPAARRSTAKGIPENEPSWFGTNLASGGESARDQSGYGQNLLPQS